jgi:hypothetical protein
MDQEAHLIIIGRVLMGKRAIEGDMVRELSRLKNFSSSFDPQIRVQNLSNTQPSLRSVRATQQAKPSQLNLLVCTHNH